FSARHARDPVLVLEKSAQAHTHALLVVHQQNPWFLGLGIGHGEVSARRGDRHPSGCIRGANGDGRKIPQIRAVLRSPAARGRRGTDKNWRRGCQTRETPAPGRRRCAISLTRWLSRSAASSRSFWCRSFSLRSSLMLWRRCSAWRSAVSSRLRSCSFSYVTPRSRSFSRSDDSTRSRRRSCSCSSSRSEATWVCPASSQRRASSPSRVCLDSALIIRTSPFV